MANIAEAIMGPSSDMSIVHSRVVRIGAVSAWFATFLFLLIGFVTGNATLVWQAGASALAGVFMSVQFLAGEENAFLGLVVSAAVIMGFYSLIGDQDTIVPAAIAMVIICALAMVFVASRVVPIVGLVGVGLFATPHLWGLSSAQAWVLGAVMSLCFFTTTVIFVSIHSAMTRLHARFQLLFEHSPTAVMEEDWAAAIAYVRSEYTGRPDRLKAFLMAYPAVVRRAVSKAEILRVNRAAVELFEADGPEALLGPRLPEKVTEDNLEAFVDALVTLYEQRTIFEHEVLTETYGGSSIWVQARAVDTSSDGSASRIIMGLVDVTHIKQRNEAMARLVKSKDEFIARVSHELRTPLTAVVGLTSELASEDTISSSEQGELLQIAAAQAAEMSYIVEDLLVAARAEMGTVSIDMTIVDLDSELRATIDGLAIDVEEAPEHLGEVCADPSRIRQILRNLLTNAERYGGPRVRVLAGEVGDWVWLEVRDDGEGVPEHMTQMIFEPYTTAHEGVAGSIGLGLSVSRQLAEMMGGMLEYRREAGETVFRLELPATPRLKRTLASNSISA